MCLDKSFVGLFNNFWQKLDQHWPWKDLGIYFLFSSINTGSATTIHHAPSNWNIYDYAPLQNSAGSGPDSVPPGSVWVC